MVNDFRCKTKVWKNNKVLVRKMKEIKKYMPERLKNLIEEINRLECILWDWWNRFEEEE